MAVTAHAGGAGTRVAPDAAQIGYTGAAAAWANGPMLAYGPFARHLLRRCPPSLTGVVALDAGAGTGAVSALLQGRGAFVVAADLQADMLRHAQENAGESAGAVAADVTALPLRSDSVDLAVAAFVLNHLADPAAGLRELGRVCRPGGAVLASTFAARRAAAKNAVDDVLRTYGWSPPEWYVTVHQRMSLIGTARQLAAAAAAAGLVDVDVVEEAIDVGLDDPEHVARYRLGMPQFVELLQTLSDDVRAALQRDAVDAVRNQREVFRPEVIELSARVR